MTHDNPAVPPVDATTTTPPDEFIEPTPQSDAAAVEPMAAEAIPFEESAQPDEAPLPETALASDTVASFTESPVPTIESAAPAGDVTLALTPFENVEADASPANASDVGSASADHPPLLFPSPGTPGEDQEEGSAQDLAENEAALPAEDSTESLVNEPAPADMEAIAAVASLSVAETDSDPADATISPSLESDDAPTPTITAPRRVLSGGWTMGLLLSGIAIIAACVLIPQGDETRKLMYEREKLRADLEQVQKQVTTNDEFLQKVQSDPTLAQRLAQRQMKLVPAGTKVLDVEDASPTKDDKSPFLIVSVPPPAPLPPYQPRGGWFAQMCRNGRSQLYMIGGGLMLVAAGLVLGASGPRD